MTNSTRRLCVIPLSAAAMCIAALPAMGSVAAQDTTFNAIRLAWDAERYSEAFDRLVRYRSSAPYGKNEVVDYMIATSACRSGRAQLGRQLFEAILYYYSLDTRSRELVTREAARCPPAVAARPFVMVANAAGPVMSGTRGKLYYSMDRTPGQEIPLANQPVKILREIPLAEFERRLFRLEQRTTAVSRVAALWGGTGVRVRSYGPFVIASRSHNEQSMRLIADGLSAYLDFFVAEFGMARPEHLITVYLVPTGDEMRASAARLHGIQIDNLSIGYSFRNDQSMVAIIPGTSFGTLAHELFHLMVRRDFGDVPPWIDEGYAALYEVSQVNSNGSVIGLPNWRGPVLATFGVRATLPKLPELLRANWHGFEAQGMDSDHQAINHAKARYFALYLQQRGKLAETYRSFRQRDVLSAAEKPGDDAVRRIEKILGASIDAIDRDFVQWFSQLKH